MIKAISLRITTLRYFGSSVILVFLACAAGLRGNAAGLQNGGRAGAAAKAFFAQAQQDLARGSLRAALHETKEGLHLSPQSIAGLNLSGSILARQGESAQALNSFKTALRLNPQSVETHDHLGSFYASQREFGPAEREFRATLRLSPQNRVANYNLGAILLSQHHARSALPFLLRVRPAGTASRVDLVEAYLETHQFVQALARARSLSGDSTRNLRVHFSLGVLLDSAGQFKPAIHELELADALKPETFEILQELGKAYLNEGDYAKADAVFGRALALNPNSVDALYLEAQTYAQEKKTLQAFQLLFKARKLAPKNTDVIDLLARLSMNLAYYSDAIPLLEEGVRIDPKQPDLHAALGESYYSAGRIADAYRQFRLLIQLDPSASSYAFMGLYYLHQGQFADAQKYFRMGLEKRPGDPRCLFNLGAIADKQGNYPAAEKFLGKALAANPNDGNALLELAAVKMNEKKYVQAIPLLRRGLKFKPNQPQAYYRLAMAERNLHQNQAAARNLKIFETLAKNPARMPMPFQHFFESVSRKASLTPKQQAEADLGEISRQIKQHPARPRNFYLLAETDLKLGQAQQALAALARFRQLSGGDARSMTGAGVLLARYRLYPYAIQYFQAALSADPASDEAKYDLADAYFETHHDAHAARWLKQISPQGQNDPSTLALLGDTEASLGGLADAEAILKRAAQMSPDDDRRYLSLSLVQIRAADLTGARQTLLEGQARIPDSGRILWGLGVLSVVEGDNQQAESDFEKALDLEPQWESSYSALGTFYFDTGQVAKATQTLDRYARIFPNGQLNVGALRRVLAEASREQPAGPVFLSPQARSQFLQMAVALADTNP